MASSAASRASGATCRGLMRKSSHVSGIHARCLPTERRELVLSRIFLVDARTRPVVNGMRSHRTGARAASYPRAKLSPGEQRGPVTNHDLPATSACGGHKVRRRAACSNCKREFTCASCLPHDKCTRCERLFCLDCGGSDSGECTECWTASQANRAHGSVFPGVSP